jgi:thioredoxin reductase (NADPH)
MVVSPDHKVYDIAIIGGGPCGLFGLFYTCIRQLDALLIDSLPELGGQLTALYPEKDIYDMPGFPKILTKELVQMMVEQATMHRQQEIVLGERVETLQRDESAGHVVLVTDKGRTVHTRTVVITTGAGAFRPNKLPVEVPAQVEGSGVIYFVKDPASLAGKRVVVVGGGDSAMDWILALHAKAASVVQVHRRDVFRAHEDSVAKVRALGVDQHLFYEVKELRVGGAGQLEQVVIENNQTHERITLDADVVVVSLGFVADMGPVKNWGLELKANSILVNSKMETNIPGVYAAGDVASYEGKIKLIATGVGEAAIAVNAAKHLIDPSQRLQPVHSTTLFEKKPVSAGAHA